MDFNFLLDYWNQGQLEVNFIIFLNLLGSLMLGLVLGYERIYQGRAAGMRTYGLVCMSSCALTVFAGYSSHWYGGHSLNGLFPDPTRVVQGIVTGIGFLGAGVIMKDGFSISGLSTAASIWICSAIGVLIGVGFYAAGISLAFLAVSSMIFIPKIESLLPQKKAIVVTIKFKEGFIPSETALRNIALQKGYLIPINGISVCMKEHCLEWHYIALAIPGKKAATITEMSNELATLGEIVDFSLSPSRH